MITENLKSIEERIQQACDRSGRKRSDVKLICVTKTKPIPMLQEAYDDGQRDFGENKVQEIQNKLPQLPDDINWHMIGHLQRNKVKFLIGNVKMIHSVDNGALAETISRLSCEHGIVTPVLIEVNVAGEDSKFGVHPADTESLIRAIAPLPGIRVKGLMTIAPYTDDPETNRPYFRALRELSIDIDKKNIDNIEICELSMGMTGDFEVAVEEGATFIRVGTGIFGERDYKQTDDHTNNNK
ncbi:MAG: YggS family pyridoxal phosphate-dependent enzyme [Lachnospiraceae bacterium]|jgi:pyridoxal phosphate enzyme (YggS family)|nr:YggS family pyridoxal phosphate-dependent enzyme [Lachnospiraceae bacterium]